MAGVGSWPGSGFPLGCRKLTLPSQAIETKVSSQARPRIHSPGQKRALARMPDSGRLSLRRVALFLVRYRPGQNFLGAIASRARSH